MQKLGAESGREEKQKLSNELLVRCCAPTLAGIKTGSLFSCPCGKREALMAELRRLNREFSPHGLRILPLRVQHGRALLYLFRPAELERDLSGRCAREILSEAGYDNRGLGRCLQCLIRRLQNGGDFPHEIGLFLSYPPEDVRGFIDNHARNYKLAGPWKVYGDVDEARRIFEKYQKCTDSYCRSLRAGFSLAQLAVAI